MAVRTIKIKLHDPSKGLNQDSNKLMRQVNCDIITLRQLFKNACDQGYFPSGATDIGLQQDEPVIIHSLDGDNKNLEKTGLKGTFLDESIEQVFSNFAIVSLVEFRLNETQQHTPLSGSSIGMKRSAAFFDVFLTVAERKKNVDAKYSKDLQGSDTPMSREELKKSSTDFTVSQPNLDRAYDHVRNWLLEFFEFRCSAAVRMNTKHMVYEFMEKFALLLLQVGC
jgi:hypothetical protein